MAQFERNCGRNIAACDRIAGYGHEDCIGVCCRTKCKFYEELETCDNMHGPIQIVNVCRNGWNVYNDQVEVGGLSRRRLLAVSNAEISYSVGTKSLSSVSDAFRL